MPFLELPTLFYEAGSLTGGRGCSDLASLGGQ